MVAIHGKNKFSLLSNDPDEGIGNVGLDVMKHIDHSLVVVQGGGTSDINGTYNKFSTHCDGSYQYSKDGPGPKKKKYSKFVRKDGQWCISYQQHVLYTNENSLGNEPPRDGWSVVTGMGKITCSYLCDRGIAGQQHFF